MIPYEEALSTSAISTSNWGPLWWEMKSLEWDQFTKWKGKHRLRSSSTSKPHWCCPSDKDVHFSGCTFLHILLTGCQRSTFKMTNDTHEMNPITQIEKETSHKRGCQTWQHFVKQNNHTILKQDVSQAHGLKWRSINLPSGCRTQSKSFKLRIGWTVWSKALLTKTKWK